MNDIAQIETLVLDPAAMTTRRPLESSATQKSPLPAGARDPEFEDLIAQYRALLRTRAIPYPVAYQFVKELGHGRQGVVFLVTRHGARGCTTHHAIKLFDPGIYSSPAKYWTDMGRIARQISMLQPANTGNLVSGEFYEECNGIGYMLMHAIDGVDLHFLLEGKHLEIARERSTPEEWEHFTRVLFRITDNYVSLRPGAALNLLRSVLRGLAILHDHGFVHGDIKPTNIMIDIQGAVKLVDLGRATRIGEQVNILLGSPLFMAPEIHRREPGLVQSDIFSAGLVGLELLNNRKISVLGDQSENVLLDFKIALARRLEDFLPAEVLQNIEFTRVLRQFIEADAINRYASARDAESGEVSLVSARQWLPDEEREMEYEREWEAYLAKLVDPETGNLNPHFASENLTAVIITN